MQQQQITKRRVVVTGMGAITPCGLTVDSLWQSVITGKSGISTIESINTDQLTCKIAGEIKDFVPENYMDKKESRRMDKFTQFAMAAAKQAFEDAGLDKGGFEPERLGAMVGCAAGGITTIENQVIEVIEKGYKRTSPFLVPMMIGDMASGRISIAYNAQGPNLSIVSACATGADSIGDAFRMIQYGEIDVAFAGGTEAPITPISVAGFGACRALSFNNDDPQGASRPFDRDRDGFIMSEGASLLIIEELEHAQRRGAKIYAELIGYGRSSDAHDVVAPEPSGRGATNALKFALREAQIEPTDVNYVNAHATSTPHGDIAETKAIKRVFGEHATSKKLLVSSTKSMTGHMLGAAGSTEAILSIMALNNQIIPPTINIHNLDPECDLDYVANTARKVENFKIAASNSFGFGGHNASLIFKNWEGN